MKGEMSTPSIRRPSSALILTAAGSVATSSRPSSGTCLGFILGFQFRIYGCSLKKTRE